MANFETLDQALIHIQNEWELSDSQMARLIHVEEQVYVTWKSRIKIAEETYSIPLGMDTAVPLVSIYKALGRRFATIEERLKWLFQENQDFGGNKPIDIAASSVEHLFWVSYYLESHQS
jgi:hypothetical protein